MFQKPNPKKKKKLIDVLRTQEDSAPIDLEKKEKLSRKVQFRKMVTNLFAYQKSPNLATKKLLEEILALIDKSYRLIGLVGIGTEGAVIKADDDAKNPLVLKVASTCFNADGKQKRTIRGYFGGFESEDENNFRERFKAGCQLQKVVYEYLKAEHVDFFKVPAIHRVSNDPGLHVEMEYIVGSDILVWLKEKNDFKYSANLFLQLLESIDFYQDYGIVHRDLKSENILISEHAGKECITIVDWTMAKIIGENRPFSLQGVRMGTVPYASPKMMIECDAKNATYMDDVYSAGIILWEFITREYVPKPRYSGELLHNKEAAKQYATELAGDVPEELRKVFFKATSVDEKKRYKTAAPFILEYKEALKEMGILEKRITTKIEKKQSKEDPCTEKVVRKIVNQRLEEILEQLEVILNDEFQEIDGRLKNLENNGNKCAECANKVYFTKISELIKEKIHAKI